MNTVRVDEQSSGVLLYALMTAIFMHIAQAIKHRFIDAQEADALPRIMPLKPSV